MERPPDHFARALVEGDEAVAADGLFAPGGVDHADDEQIAVDDGAGDAAAVAGDPAVFLGQRVLPEDLAVLVEAEEQALRAVRVDVAGFGIADQLVQPRRSRTMSVRKTLNLCSQSTLPSLASKHITRSCWLNALADAVDDVDAAVLHDGRGDAAVRRAPERLSCALA